jgi:hypothetical protein
MAIDERARHELHRKLEEVLGAEEAATLMAHLPPVGWADVATKHDLAQLEERLNLRFQSIGRPFRREARPPPSRTCRPNGRFRRDVCANDSRRGRRICPYGHRPRLRRSPRLIEHVWVGERKPPVSGSGKSPYRMVTFITSR